MPTDDLNAAVDRINAGAEIATVDPSLIEYIWKKISSIPKELRQRASGGHLAVLAEPDRMPQSGDQRAAMMMRYSILNALVERGILDEYMKDESLRQKVFAAAALFPCDKHDLGEAVTQRPVRESSTDVVQKTVEEAAYDPEHPQVGEKFIEWMRHHC
jgi:hypothetical protein